MNESPREKYVDILDLKSRNMLWPEIKYTMYSFQSISDRKMFIPREARLDI
jgi:hypothetical protein